MSHLRWVREQNGLRKETRRVQRGSRRFCFKNDFSSFVFQCDGDLVPRITSVDSLLIAARTRIVDHEFLAGLQAGFQKTRFPGSRFQQVQADAHMSREKLLSIKRGFSGSRYACKNDGLHVIVALRPEPMEIRACLRA